MCLVHCCCQTNFPQLNIDDLKKYELKVFREVVLNPNITASSTASAGKFNPKYTPHEFAVYLMSLWYDDKDNDDTKHYHSKLKQKILNRANELVAVFLTGNKTNKYSD